VVGERKTPDEWSTVGEVLGESGLFLAIDSRFARSIRSLVIRLSDPDIAVQDVDAIGRLTDEFNRLAADAEGRT
jgi:hypothetical protein